MQKVWKEQCGLEIIAWFHYQTKLGMPTSLLHFNLFYKLIFHWSQPKIWWRKKDYYHFWATFCEIFSSMKWVNPIFPEDSWMFRLVQWLIINAFFVELDTNLVYGWVRSPWGVFSMLMSTCQGHFLRGINFILVQTIH